MHICYGSRIFASQKFGGVSRYFYEIARRLAKRPGIETTIVAPIHVNSYVRGGDARVMGVSVPDVRHSWRIRYAVNSVIEPWVYRLCRPDVVHETYYDHSKVPSGAASVVTVYDMLHERFPQMFSGSDRTSEQKRKSVGRADHVICISEQTRKDLIEYFDAPADKLSVVHLGSTLLQTAGPVPRASRAVPEGEFILYVGNRGGYKNFSNVLKAYANSPRLREKVGLVCFGGGEFNQVERQRLRDLGFRPEQVVQLGGGDNVLAELYRDASVFVYPSLYEGFGIPLLEAMSSGCPVACSNVAPLLEVAGEAAATFDPASVEEIGTTLESLVDSNEERTSLIDRGHARAKLFSWEKCADETVRVYQGLLK